MNISFLKDVLVCSLGAFGGPEAHFSVFYSQLVEKKKYIDESELIELNALCSILPGPTSTQTITAIGLKIGGKMLAFLTLVVWALPIIIVMSIFAVTFPILLQNGFSIEFFSYVIYLALAFVIVAAYKISKKVIIDKMTLILALVVMVVTLFIKNAFIYPILLIVGGFVALQVYHQENMWKKITLKVSWRYLLFFIFIAITSYFLVSITQSVLLNLIYQFYKFGYLVFGGGQVVLPLMIDQFVDISHYLTLDEFLLGYGLIQGMPGPMFAFSSFVGGLALRDAGVLVQLFAGFISGISIFLPGVLLIYFIFPIWQDLRDMKGIKIALKGVSAVACGLLLSTALNLVLLNVNSMVSIVVVCLLIGLLLTKKVPAPLLVLATLFLGFI